MNINQSDLKEAAEQNLISHEQAESLWSYFSLRMKNSPRFDFLHVLYYAGALVVISSMGWFMTNAWERFGGSGILIISSLYALAFVMVGNQLWSKSDLKIPGGLLITCAVGMVPLMVYGFQRTTGLWPQGDPGAYQNYHYWIKGSWFFIELGTILAALLALRFFRFPFLTAPIAFSLWYMSMDLTPLLFGKTDFTTDERLHVSLVFGLIMLVATYLIDRRTREDYAFWGYLFGMCSFWGGLSLMDSQSEWSKFCYCLINIGLMMTSIFLNRKVFIIFGALGVSGYMGHLANTLFKDSLLFPFALSLLGLLIILAGIKYQKNKKVIENWVLSRLPKELLRLRPEQRNM